jgi:hypothetical protein
MMTFRLKQLKIQLTSGSVATDILLKFKTPRNFKKLLKFKFFSFSKPAKTFVGPEMEFLNRHF